MDCFTLSAFRGEDGKVRGRRGRELRRLGDLRGVLRCLSEAVVVPPPGEMDRTFSSFSLMDVD